MDQDEEYIDKQECCRRGYVRHNGKIYKMTLLEKYAARGWLEFGDPKFSVEDRLRAAKRLQKDYEMSRFMSVSASDFRERVDVVGRGAGDLETICRARESYFAAVKQIPAEFWPVVKAVCLENKEPDWLENMPKRTRAEANYAKRCDLCRGLDRLLRHYWAV